MVTTELDERRLAWIEALESGSYKQGQGSLFQQEFNCPIDCESFYSEPGTQQYCCLGVARNVPDPEWSINLRAVQTGDVGSDYDFVTSHYEIDQRLKHYLIGMNDGEVVWSNSGAQKIRHCNTSRDFPFVARFLRKVWGLTGV